MMPNSEGPISLLYLNSMVRKQSLDLFARVLDAAEYVADVLSSFLVFPQRNWTLELKACAGRFTSSH